MTSTDRHENAVLAHLEAARARLAAGASIPEALEAVPADDRDEVAALIAVTSRVETLAAGPTPEFVARLAATLDASAREARSRRPSRWRRWRTSIGSSLAMRAALVGATTVVLLLGTGFAAVEASAGALPGDTLYPVKEARERVERWLARSDADRMRVDQRHLDRRTDELATAVDQARDGAVVETLESALVGRVRALVDRALALDAQGDSAAVPRARQSLIEIGQRLRDLADSAHTPEQRQAIARAARFLRTQLARLEAAGGPTTDRPLRDATPLRDLLPRRDTATSTPAPDRSDRR